MHDACINYLLCPHMLNYKGNEKIKNKNKTRPLSVYHQLCITFSLLSIKVYILDVEFNFSNTWTISLRKD